MFVFIFADNCIPGFVGRAIGGCTNIHARLYFIKALRIGVNTGTMCTARFKCKDLVTKPMTPSLVKITCEKGYEVDLTRALDHCQVCKGEWLLSSLTLLVLG